jgi:RNase P protein component
MRYTWKKKEKLKSRKRIERVFREGKSFSLFPYRVCFLLQPLVVLPGSSIEPQGEPGGAGEGIAAEGATDEHVAEEGKGSTGEGVTASLPAGPGAPFDLLQAGFGASSRHFKKAVDRNRIKRLGREAYRLQKEPLRDRLREKQLSLAVFFIYTGKELPDYRVVTEKIGVALQKLIREIA